MAYFFWATLYILYMVAYIAHIIQTQKLWANIFQKTVFLTTVTLNFANWGTAKNLSARQPVPQTQNQIFANECQVLNAYDFLFKSEHTCSEKMLLILALW